MPSLLTTICEVLYTIAIRFANFKIEELIFSTNNNVLEIICEVLYALSNNYWQLIKNNSDNIKLLLKLFSEGLSDIILF